MFTPVRCLVPGRAEGVVVHSDTPLSFWMGVDTNTGRIIDRHHPLCGRSITGTIVALPGGRGSCSGSIGLLELIVNRKGPAGLVLESEDPVLALGALVAHELFGRTLPVVSVGATRFAALATATGIAIDQRSLVASGPTPWAMEFAAVQASSRGPALTDGDRAILSGAEGEARRIALRVILRFAELLGATELIDVAQAHIDCCFYTGPAGLDFAERLVGLGAAVKVPTTTNATTLDARRWRAQGIDVAFGEMSERVAGAYVAMGARPSFTCAPYLLDGAPTFGQQIAWGESNAVAYANSVLGARTMKYPDLLDVCVALTGRAPLAATHTEEGRRATLHVEVDEITGIDDAFYPLLGYHVGHIAGYDIPVITGLEGAGPDADDLKAFSAAFATSSASPMFHIVGATPEAMTRERVMSRAALKRRVSLRAADLLPSWRDLNSATLERVDLVSLGTPHFSATEIARTVALCRGRRKADGTRAVITCGRDVFARAEASGMVEELERFGFEVLNDTCWCMVDDKQLPAATRLVMTNSAKFAHYGPGVTGRSFHFGSLAACIDAACTGFNRGAAPAWLGQE